MIVEVPGRDVVFAQDARLKIVAPVLPAKIKSSSGDQENDARLVSIEGT